MLFTSLDFAVFLPIAFALYWLRGADRRWQNGVVVAASYVFYGWWDPRFLVLMLISSLTDYLAARAMQRYGRRDAILYTALGINLGMLGFFKYFGFFVDAFRAGFTWMGHPVGGPAMDIILPVGISFYTFQTMSYTIDVYRRRLEAEPNLIAFLAYVSFFPQLVAGPIERGTRLLPQFRGARVFSSTQAIDGLRQMLWGGFKKVLVADQCAPMADAIFADPGSQSGGSIALGALLFTLQIYGDFSGYSDMAIGMARLFGIGLMSNFAYPFFSRDIAEFWRRWHMSLTTWLRDYLYIPLGGSRGGRWMAARNTTLVFVVSGLWHGANWTFVLWGLMHALFFLPLLLTGRHRQHLDTAGAGRRLPTWSEGWRMLGTFACFAGSMILFRSNTLEDAGTAYAMLLSPTLLTPPADLPGVALGFAAVMLALEWRARRQRHALEGLATRWPRVLRWCLYAAIALGIVGLAQEEQPFIYFQF